MPEEEYDHIEIRSEEVQEILSDIPGWLLKWGISVLFGIVLAIILLSWIIKYPDRVPARVVVTTETPPEHIVAKSGGKVSLLVEEGQWIDHNEVLAVIKNPAKYQDILLLDSMVQRAAKLIYNQYFDPFQLELRTNLDLGSVQADYGNYYEAVVAATRTKKFAAVQEQIESAKFNLSGLKKRREILLDQQKNVLLDLETLKKIFETDSFELSLGVKDSITFLRDKRNTINSKQSLNNIKTQLLQNTIDIRRAENTLAELSFNQEDDGEALRNRIKIVHSNLEVSLERWKDQYLFSSSSAGTVSLSKFWTDNQNIQPGEELLVVIPEGSRLLGRMELPIAGSGKVEKGQKVNIKFDNYPSNDFGMLIGEIQSISLIPREEKYIVTVEIPQRMISTYRKEIPFRQEMSGSADIITEDKRLFHRIFNQLRELLGSTLSGSEQ